MLPNATRFLILAGLALGSAPSWAQAPAGTDSAQTDEHFTEFDQELTWPKLPEPPVGAPDARLAVYFDLVGRTRSRAAGLHEPFEFFLVALDPHLPIVGWEAKVTVDEPLQILEEELVGLNVGKGGEYRVGLKPMECLEGSVVVLARFRANQLELGADLVIHVSPVAQSTVRDPDRPGYVMCRRPLEARPFQFENTAAVVNPLKLKLPDERPAADRFQPARGRDD
jgi:hypothetical protein